MSLRTSARAVRRAAIGLFVALAMTASVAVPAYAVPGSAGPAIATEPARVAVTDEPPGSGLASVSGSALGIGDVGLPKVMVDLTSATAGVSRKTVWTDASGAYRFEELLPGTYFLTFRAAEAWYSYSWQPVGWDGGSFDVALGDQLTGLDARFTAETASISGVVTYPDGSPVQGGRVSADGRVVSTDATGAYRVEGLRPGAHTVRFDPAAERETEIAHEYWNDAPVVASADPVEVAEGASVTGIDAQLPVGGSLSGVVTLEDGTPVVDAPVWIQATDSGFFLDRGTRTDPSGAYRFGGLPTGDYTVSVFPEGCVNGGWWPDASSQPYAETIAVTVGKDVVGRDMQLTAGSTISGTVTTSPPTYRPDVILYRPSGSEATAVAEPDGSYEFCVRTPGEYTVGFSQDSGLDVTFLSEWWNDQDHRATADWIAVESGDIVTGIDAELTSGATISGVVTGGGAPVSGSRITAHGEVEGGEPWYRTTTADAAGAYRFPTMPSGTYTLEVEPPDGSIYLDEWWGNRPDQASAVRFDVAKDATVSGMDVRLSVGASISGTVVDATGGPVAGAEVASRRSDGDPVGTKQVVADANGAFQIGGLPAGAYVLDFSAAGYFAASADAVEVGPSAQVAVGETKLTPIATITGKVTAEGGYHLPESALVRLYRLQDGEYRRVTDGTTQGGVYTFGYLRAGKYKIEFRQGWNTGYVDEWWSDQPDPASATVIELSAGQKLAAVDAALAGGPVRLASPTVSGTAAVGSTLSAGASSTTPETTLTYQWLANGAEIAGATGSTFQLTSAQLGMPMSVRVTGSAPGHTTASETSKPTAVVALGTIVLEGPTVEGTARVGSPLTAKASTAVSGVTYAYQWLAEDAVVSGATGSTFTPTEAQLGKRISVRVTASALAYAASVKTSPRTAPVATDAPPPVDPVELVRVSGADRFATAVAVSKSRFSPGVPVVYVANGLNFPDALAGAPLAGMDGGPVLLTPPTALPAAVAAEVARLKPAKVVVLGSEGVVSRAVADELARLTARGG